VLFRSRLATAQIFADEKKESAIAFLQAAIAYYQSLGITVSRVMTDNGSCYRSKAFARACKAFGIKHITTRPYTPQTNGKAERFIQTALREWAYASAYQNSDQRRSDLPLWLHRYNWHRPHASLAKQTPISRLGLTRNNLLQLHSYTASESTESEDGLARISHTPCGLRCSFGEADMASGGESVSGYTVEPPDAVDARRKATRRAG
jgi:hypothetical protein